MFFAITLSYDGTGFVGWQRQAAGTSVQGLLEDALRDLDQRDVAVTGAGRTDAGVHALGQVASFALARSIDAATLVRALNARLPETVRIVSASAVAEAFHARYDATRKTYRYRIWNADILSPFERAYAWHIAGHLDTKAMDEAARLVEGRRDFAAFQAAGAATTTSVREVFSSRISHRAGPDKARPTSGLGDEGWPASGPGDVGRGLSAPPASALVEYEVVGSGFLRHMVRTIVGSLVEIGLGRRPVTWMTTVVEGRDRSRAGPTAPPHGLVLVAVEYGSRLLAAER